MQYTDNATDNGGPVREVYTCAPSQDCRHERRSAYMPGPVLMHQDTCNEAPRQGTLFGVRRHHDANLPAMKPIIKRRPAAAGSLLTVGKRSSWRGEPLEVRPAPGGTVHGCRHPQPTNESPKVQVMHKNPRFGRTSSVLISSGGGGVELVPRSQPCLPSRGQSVEPTQSAAVPPREVWHRPVRAGAPVMDAPEWPGSAEDQRRGGEANGSIPPRHTRARPTNGAAAAPASGAWASRPTGYLARHIEPEAPRAPTVRYTVRLIGKCGSLFEEMARQLLATGEWRQAESSPKLDAVAEPVHLFLGEKLFTEQKIKEQLQQRLRVGRGDSPLQLFNYIVGTRNITLKSKMVKTLLRFHKGSWRDLGMYVPLTFQVYPRQSYRDERAALAAEMTSRGGGPAGRTKKRYWIAKSSIGCHGADIRIFSGDNHGYNQLVDFIDSPRATNSIWVVSEYISRPLLYERRKFDIRCWILVTPDFEIYCYDELVMRTSSAVYHSSTITTDSVQGRLAHITNHCVQAEGTHYSLYERGNELWRDSLGELIRSHSLAHGMTLGSLNGCGASDLLADEVPSLERAILPQVHHIVVNTLLAVKPSSLTDPRGGLRCFQCFGYDFLIDEALRVWLLEVNGSPGVAEKLLPRLVRDTIELVVAPHFPGTNVTHTPHKAALSARNGYRKIYPLA